MADSIIIAKILFIIEEDYPFSGMKLLALYDYLAILILICQLDTLTFISGYF